LSLWVDVRPSLKIWNLVNNWNCSEMRHRKVHTLNFWDNDMVKKYYSFRIFFLGSLICAPIRKLSKISCCVSVTVTDSFAIQNYIPQLKILLNFLWGAHIKQSLSHECVSESVAYCLCLSLFSPTSPSLWAGCPSSQLLGLCLFSFTSLLWAGFPSSLWLLYIPLWGIQVAL
jgi:hypothetical protein